MSNINFDNPWLLLVGIPLLLLVVIPFAIAVRKENRNIHNVLSLLCHILIVVAVTLGVAGMNYDAMITRTDVYVLADVSYSSNNNLDVLDGYVRAVEKALPKNSRISLIAFGRDYEMLTDLGEELVSVREAKNVDASATDITNALRYAGNLFEDDVIKRIVVITDGRETVDDSKMKTVVSRLQEENIYIDVVYLDNNLAEDVREIQLTDVQYTASAFKGKEETAQLQINSNNPDATRIYIDVTCNDHTTTTTQTIYAGQNVISVPLSTEEAGKFEYVISVRPEKEEMDTSLYNNACLVTQNVSEKINVLFLGGSDIDCYAGRKIYGTENVLYMTDPAQVPFTAEDLCVYDEIVLCNFDVRTLPNGHQFLSSLDMLVSKFGKTLTTYGNTYIQEIAVEENELLSNLGGMLPVNVGNTDQDGRLMVILLDISTSTNFSSRLAIARSATTKLLETLNDEDQVMVLGFAGESEPLLALSSAKNKDVILSAVSNYTPVNGTYLQGGLEFAQKMISGLKFNKRELVIISDGEYTENEQACLDVAEEMSANNIIISALGIYSPSDTRPLLEKIVKNDSANGKGYYQAIANADDVDYVIGDIVEEMQKVRVEGSTYSLTLQQTQDQVLNGVKTLEHINGFWYNSVKSSATAVVTAGYKKDKVNTLDVPIYSYWEYGNGRVASFMSDISSNWIADWDLSGEKGNEISFLNNIRSTMLPEEQVETPFLFEVEVEGNTTKVTVSTSAFYNDAELSLTLNAPDGTVQNKTMVYDSENYVCEFETNLTGQYGLHMVYDYANVHYEVDRDFDISYYPEYDSFTSYNVASLYRIISENGEVSLDGQLKMDNSESATRSYTFSFIVPLMTVCVVAFVVDIIIRMLRWKDIRSLFVHESKDTRKRSK